MHSEELDNTDEDELFEHHRFVVDKGQGIMRLDQYLTHKVLNATRNKVQVAIETGSVRVNEQISKASYKIKPADVITVAYPHPPRITELLAEELPLNIVYEDDDLIIVNKEAGMVVHPAHGNWDGTLVNGLLYHFAQLPTRSGEARPGLVHRIDKDTSGLMVIAKTDHAMVHLAKQFFDHSIERTYYALVWGVFEEPTGTITANVGRSLQDRRVTTVFADGSQGKNAVTHYKVLKDLRYVSLVQCNLETGRTHQIRAHMKYIKHPLFSDATYGGDKIVKGQQFTKYKQFVENCFALCPRQALHAKSLGFVHPKTGQWVQFDSELPADFQGVLSKWERYVTE